MVLLNHSHPQFSCIHSGSAGTTSVFSWFAFNFRYLQSRCPARLSLLPPTTKPGDILKDTVRLLCATLALVSASYASVTVSSPATGSTLGSPVHVVASASGNLPITGMRIYVDSVSVYHVSSSSINASIPVAAGNHNVVVMSWASSVASHKSGTI